METITLCLGEFDFAAMKILHLLSKKKEKRNNYTVISMEFRSGVTCELVGPSKSDTLLAYKATVRNIGACSP